MRRYTVIKSKCWRHKTGKTASIYGSLPWTNPEDENNWQMITRGYTVRDNKFNTIGMGKPPFETEQDAISFIKKLGGNDDL